MSEETVKENVYGYDKLTITELRKVIADLTKETISLKDDKKEYVAGLNDVLKDIRLKTESAVEVLRTAERTQGSQELDKMGDRLLAAVKSS